MKFVQHIGIRTSKIDEIVKLGQDSAPEGNEEGVWILKDRDNEGRYVISVVFNSAEEAMANNDKPETQEFAKRMAELVDGEPEWGNYDLIDKM